MSIVVARPMKGPLRILMPYRTDNRAFLKAIAGSNARGIERRAPYWRAPRSRMDRIVRGLVAEYGSVTVKLQGAAQTTCVEACWDADPNTAIDCVCGCAGSNHGSKMPLGPEVRPGLSIGTKYSTRTYEVSA